MKNQPLHPRTAAINQKQKNCSKQSRLQALTWLAMTFPQAFDNSQRIRPLKLGIMKDLLNCADQASESGISRSKLREAVVIFTRRIDYLTCLKAKEVRIDLFGNPEAVVTEDEAESAALKIKKRVEKNAKNARKLVADPGVKPFKQPNVSLLPEQSNLSLVNVKHKQVRSFDPAAVARLKEKLGLSQRSSQNAEV